MKEEKTSNRTETGETKGRGLTQVPLVTINANEGSKMHRDDDKRQVDKSGQSSRKMVTSTQI